MIKFGTDGWRGVISKEFTFDNLQKVAVAHGLMLKEEGAKRVVVGYDLRFLSEEYGKFVAETLAGMGLEVDLSDGFCPTPAVSYNTKYGKYDNGIVITASHNYKVPVLVNYSNSVSVSVVGYSNVGLNGPNLLHKSCNVLLNYRLGVFPSNEGVSVGVYFG